MPISVIFRRDLPGVNTQNQAALATTLFGGFVSSSLTATSDPGLTTITLTDPATRHQIRLTGTFTLDQTGTFVDGRVSSIGIFDGAGGAIVSITGLPTTTTINAALALTSQGLSALFGGQGVNLDGTNGNDVLMADTGNDVLRGFLGNDVYVVQNVGDTILENPNEGTDIVQSPVSYTLPANVETLTLTGAAVINGTGNAGNNTINGNEQNNMIAGQDGMDILYGFGGNDQLNGGSGTDNMNGGLGNDIYVVDNLGDVVNENVSAGIDTVQSTVNYTLGTNVESLTFTGGLANNGTGNGLANVLTGNSRGNRFMGAGGNDTLNGGAGNDTGVYSGLRSAYNIVRSGRGFSAVSGGTDGADTLSSIENLRFLSGGMLYGNFALVNQKGFSDRGKNDVLWRNSNGAVTVWYMDGFNVVGGGNLSSSPGTAWKLNGTGDFNGDGKTDLLWRNDTGLMSLWTMNGTTLAASGAPSTPSLSMDWKISGTGDFNGDGKSDILWRHSSGLIAVWNMNGTTLLASGPTSTSTLPIEWKVAGTGDFNGDGKSDILWRHNSGQIAVWNMNGTTLLASGLTSTSSLPVQWKVAGTGDFNADGNSDILWRHDSGQIAVWNMNGTTLEASGLTSVSSLDLSWRVADTGDYNGDGRSDILWRQSTGASRIWMMDGTTVLSAGAPSSSLNTTWQVAGQSGNVSAGGAGNAVGAMAKQALVSDVLNLQSVDQAVAAFDASSAASTSPSSIATDAWAQSNALLDTHLASTDATPEGDTPQPTNLFNLLPLSGNGDESGLAAVTRKFA